MSDEKIVITKDNFGPVLVSQDPNWPLHDLCTAFPRACDEDIEEMCRATRLLGGIINDPATVWEGHILDGGNRQKVARLCKVPLEYREFSGVYAQAKLFVLVKNLGRRHLTVGQKAAIAASIVAVDKKRGVLVGSQRDAVARLAKSSRATADQALKVQREGGDEALKRVASGESTLSEELDEIARHGDDDPTGRNVKRDKPFDIDVEVMTDDYGTEVPEKLHDVWGSRTAFLETRSHILTAQEAYKRLVAHPAAWGISVEYGRHLKDLASDLDAKQPGAVCPHCLGEGVSQAELSTRRWRLNGCEKDVGKCYLCKGRGYRLKDEPIPEPEWHHPSIKASA